MGFFIYGALDMYSTYVIKSVSQDILYIGHTNNLEDRIKRHNSNRNKYTAGKGPWELIFSCDFASRKEAVQLEKKLKSYKNKKYLLDWIAKHGKEHPDLPSGGH